MILPSTATLPILLIIQLMYSQSQCKSSKRKAISKSRLFSEKKVHIYPFFSCISFSVLLHLYQHINLDGYKNATVITWNHLNESICFIEKYCISYIMFSTMILTYNLGKNMKRNLLWILLRTKLFFCFPPTSQGSFPSFHKCFISIGQTLW